MFVLGSELFCSIGRACFHESYLRNSYFRFDIPVEVKSQLIKVVGQAIRNLGGR